MLKLDSRLLDSGWSIRFFVVYQRYSNKVVKDVEDVKDVERFPTILTISNDFLQ